MESSPRAGRLTLLGLFLVALATLTYEILLTRIFSVTMFYHFAFVAISVAMFGMTVGALIVYVRPHWFPPSRIKRDLAATATAFAVAIVFSFLTQLSVPFLVHPSVVAAFAIAFTYFVIAVPFVIGGVCVSLALTRFEHDLARLYAADLAGAAAGCLVLVGLMRVTDGPTAVIAVAALAAAGGLVFAWDSGHRRMTRIAAAVAIVLAGAAALHTGLVWRHFPVLRILYVKGGFEARPLYEKWNSYSRVRVNGDPSRPEEPFGWGLSRRLPASDKVPQLKMDIDVLAGTVMTGFDGDTSKLAHLRYDVTNAPYYVLSRPKVAVIGAGGGRDVLSALAFGAESVTAIEINDAILDTVNRQFGSFTGHLDRHPSVRFVNDEARSYLTRTSESFDLIQISLIDTWAATASGAFVLSENSLYTVEAWRTFLARLSPTGILSVSRWYFQDRPGEVYRLIALATQAMLDMGVADPRPHMLVVRNLRDAAGGGQPEGVGTLMLSRSPLTDADLDAMDRISALLDFEVVLSPRVSRDATFEALASGRDLAGVTSRFPINIAPPTDDSPFFFQMMRVRDLLNVGLLQSGKNSANMQAVFVLVVLFLTVAVLATGGILFPLFVAGPRPSLAGSGWLVAFFASIGFGFMLIETSQAQRLIIVLGHPVYGLSVVLFALLLASGAGSYLTRNVSAADLAAQGTRRLSLLLVSLVAFGVLTRLMMPWLEGQTTSVRIAGSAAILAIPGLFMGMAFPLGMKAGAGRPELLPWLWGVNGATSVCASVLAVVIALTWSISAAFWAGCACYAVGLLAFSRACPRLRSGQGPRLR
jgi:hypothetical protein